jgi:hypothetical protein
MLAELVARSASDLTEAGGALTRLQGEIQSLKPISVLRSSRLPEIRDDTQSAVQLNEQLEVILLEINGLVSSLWSRYSDVLEKITSPAVNATGVGLNVAREAGDDEACLDVDDYADVLAELFSLADDGEFCFALFGHWGRGKTFLIRRMERALATRSEGYQIIHFSAWKYPTAPEVWVHLYETIAKVAFDTSWRLAMPNIIRTAIAKHGSARLLKAYALLALGVTPFFSLLGLAGEALNVVYVIFGIAGLIWLWSLIRSVHRTNARLAKEYLTATRHAEKLGLQATIGDDLRALLLGWMPTKSLSTTFLVCYWVVTAGVLLGTWLRLTGLESAEAWTRLHLGWNVALNPGFWSAIAIEGLLLGLAVVLIQWIRFGGASPRRIVLVVDDLDRCKTEHLLSVMESIKLLIEAPEISRRVQVAMLLEEDILKHAIFEKYGSLADPERAKLLSTFYDADRLMRENCEKLFTASIRLPKLSATDLKDLVETFSGRRRKLEAAGDVIPSRSDDRSAAQTSSPGLTVSRPPIANSMQSPPGTRSVQTIFASSPWYGRIGSFGFGQFGANTRRPLRKPAIVLEENEISAILSVLASGNIQLRENIGPRSIRAFLFRYQLARLLLAKLNVDWHPIELVEELVTRFLAARTIGGDVSSSAPQFTQTDKLKTIAEQVS